MKVAAAVFLAAAAFAWLASHELLRLDATGATPPAIVLHRGAGAPTAALRRPGRFAVPRKVELAPLRAFPGQQKQATRP